MKKIKKETLDLRLKDLRYETIRFERRLVSHISHLTSLILISLYLTSQVCSAQTISPNIISSNEYHKLKKEGKLTGKELVYKTTGGTQQELHITIPTKESARNNNNNSVLSTPCNCWIPRDGTFSVVPFDGYTAPNYSNDDGSTLGITLPFNFCLYGNTVGGAGDQLYINNNGNISFGASYSTFSPVGFPSSAYVMIAPFWGDVDTETPQTNGGVVYYKLTPTYLIVQWDSVGVFDHSTPAQINTFQLIITDGSDPILPAGNNISFCYGEMQWTTGDASMGGGTGFDGSPAYPATVGLNKGDGTTFTQIGQFGVPGSTYTGSTGVSGVGWLTGQSFYFNSCGAGGSLPPVVTSGGPPNACIGDTLTICAVGGTLTHTVSFIPPSTTGSVSATATSPSLGTNFSVVSSTSGANASLTFQVNSTGLTAGYYSVTVTATNEVPLSTTLNFIIHVVNATSFPIPAIAVTPSVNCGNIPSVVILTNSSSYTTYTWSTGATTPSITVATTSTVQVTVSQGGCVNTGSVSVQISPSPTVTVNSPTICAGNTATLTAGGAITYTWKPWATLSSDTGTTVTGTPIITTNYTVTGTDGNGCKDSITTTITVNTSPTVTANSPSICVGQQTATLTASGAVTYSWNPSTTLSSNTGTTVTGTPTVTTIYTVTGTGTNGCINTGTTNITVNPLPSVTVPSATICAGETVTLTASGATNYSWAPGIGLSSTVGTSVIANPVTTQSYTIVGTNAAGCTNTVTTLVTINTIAAPTATSNTPCANQALSLTCLPNGLANYAWAGPNSYTSSIQNPIRTGVTASAAGTYTVVIHDINNCTSTTTISVIVNPLPIVTASATPVCLNQTINLFATNGDSLYSWSGPSGYTSPLQNPFIPNASASMAGVYVVTVTDGNGCFNASTIYVAVYPLPTIEVTSPTICVASTETLTASGAANYTWSPATDLSATFGNQVLIIPSTATNHTYTVIGQDMNGCVNTATTTITVNDTPSVNVTPAITKGCTPQCVKYTATNNPAASKYNWNFGNGQPSTESSPTACFTVSSTYTVKLILTDVNGCVNTATASVIAEPVPVPDFDYQPNPVSILAPKVQFINQSYVVGGATGYTWNFGDSLGTNNSSILKNPTYTYPAIGTYYVTLIDSSSDGCWASIVKPVYIEPDFTLYVPNSFSPNGDGKNEIFLAQGEGILGFKMYVFDRWGNNIFTTDDINVGWDGTRNNKGDILLQDVYVWKIDLSNVLQQGKSYSGTVTLLK
ncbi:MAG: nidogen-like domain-containing protein [Bacteroidia bacterium]